MDLSNEGTVPSVNEILLNAGVLTFGLLFKMAGLAFENVDAVASCLGVKSRCIMTKLLEKWKSALLPEEIKLLGEYTEGIIAPNVMIFFLICTC